MEVKGVPALTRTLPADATLDDRTDLNDEQILELEQQIVCYRGMIRERKKVNTKLEKLKKQKTSSVQQSLLRGLLGDDDRLRSKKKRRKRFIQTKKSKKTKKKSKRKRR